MKNFVDELKRRNVVRVAIAYSVVAWAILQFVDIVQDPMSLPDWFQRVTLVTLAIGLPIALILSWAYEMTPEGVKKTAEVDQSKSITHGTGQKINKLIIGALSLAVAFLLYDKFILSPDAPPEIIQEAQAAQTSIAVLPFVNMSADPEQEFFSDGITEEILNVLAKNRSLRVAGRTSSFAFKGENQDLRAIGETLGVQYLVEGSVRKGGDTVRITAQVIQASDGFHIWSETYDRQLTDVFAVQDEIARAVADALEVSFGLAEGESLVANTTNNMAAYDLYLQAREAHKFRNIPEAVALSKQVIEMDPDFAPGWAVYAQVLALSPDYIHGLEPFESAADYARAEIAALHALYFDPNSVLAYGALGNIYRARRDWQRAEQNYLKALAIDPDSPAVLEDYVEFLLTVGKISEAAPLAEKLYALEPRVPIFIRSQIAVYLVQGKFEEAAALGAIIHSINNETPIFVFFYAETLFWNGEYDRVRAVIDEFLDPEDTLYIDFDLSLKLVTEGVEALTPEEIEYASEVPVLLGMMGQTDALFEQFAYMTPLGWWGDYYNFSADSLPYLSTPQFKTYIQQMGLPNYWRTSGWGDYCRPLGTDDFECSQ